MNILYGVDKRSYLGAELSIYSLLKHNKKLNIFIFTMDYDLHYEDGAIRAFEGVTPEQQFFLKKMVKYLDPQSTITFIDCKEYYIQYLEGNRNQYSLFTPFAPLRMLADIILPEIDDIWYLDCDTVVQDSIQDIYDYYLTDPEDVDYYAYAMPFTNDWEETMISGVMFMNLKRMRQSGYLEKARKYLFEHDCPFYDQDALANAGRWGHMDETYDYLFELNKCCYTPVILHFNCELIPKIYDAGYGVNYFYRKFSHLQPLREGINNIHYLVDNGCL